MSVCVSAPRTSRRPFLSHRSIVLPDDTTPATELERQEENEEPVKRLEQLEQLELLVKSEELSARLEQLEELRELKEHADENTITVKVTVGGDEQLDQNTQMQKTVNALFAHSAMLVKAEVEKGGFIKAGRRAGAATR